MEKILIPSYQKFWALTLRIGSFDVLSTYLKKYMSLPFHKQQLSAPVFVLRYIAYNQQAMIFGREEHARFVQCLKDVSYIVQTAAPSTQVVPEPKMEFESSFTREEMNKIKTMMAELKRRMTAHREYVTKLQKAQQDLMDCEEHQRKRASVRESFAELCRNNPENNIIQQRFEESVAKMIQVSKAVNEASVRYTDRIAKECKARQQLVELAADVRSIITVGLTIKITKMVTSLRATLRIALMKPGFEKFEFVYNRLSVIDPHKLTADIINTCSKTYFYTKSDEFIKLTGGLEKIPNCSIAKTGLSFKEINFTHLYSSKETGSGDTDSCQLLTAFDGKTGDKERYVTVAGESYVGSLHHVVKDQDFKQKLSLLDNAMMFGWTRKHIMGRKTWIVCPSHMVV